MLTEHGVTIAPSTCYARRGWPVSAAELADAYDLTGVKAARGRCLSELQRNRWLRDVVGSPTVKRNH